MENKTGDCLEHSGNLSFKVCHFQRNVDFGIGNWGIIDLKLVQITLNSNSDISERE